MRFGQDSQTLELRLFIRINTNQQMIKTLLLSIIFYLPMIIFGQINIIQSAEFFWGINDPGVGNGTQFFANDGNFDESVEHIFKNS